MYDNPIYEILTEEDINEVEQQQENRPKLAKRDFPLIAKGTYRSRLVGFEEKTFPTTFTGDIAGKRAWHLEFDVFGVPEETAFGTIQGQRKHWVDVTDLKIKRQDGQIEFPYVLYSQLAKAIGVSGKPAPEILEAAKGYDIQQEIYIDKSGKRNKTGSFKAV